MAATALSGSSSQHLHERRDRFAGTVLRQQLRAFGEQALDRARPASHRLPRVVLGFFEALIIASNTRASVTVTRLTREVTSTVPETSAGSLS